MTAEEIFSVVCAVLGIAASVKIFMTLAAQDKCIEIDATHYLKGAEFWEMLFSLRKWTFAQHYPELAKRVSK